MGGKENGVAPETSPGTRDTPGTRGQKTFIGKKWHRNLHRDLHGEAEKLRREKRDPENFTGRREIRKTSPGLARESSPGKRDPGKLTGRNAGRFYLPPLTVSREGKTFPGRFAALWDCRLRILGDCFPPPTSPLLAPRESGNNLSRTGRHGART